MEGRRSATGVGLADFVLGIGYLLSPLECKICELRDVQAENIGNDDAGHPERAGQGCARTVSPVSESHF